MSLADDLNAIQKLHENGSLTDEEFAAAKATIIGGPTHSSDTGVKSAEKSSQASLPSVKTQSKARKLLKSGLFLIVCVLIAVVLVAGGKFFLLTWYNRQMVNRSVQTIVHAPMEIRDSVESVSASSWRAVPLSL